MPARFSFRRPLVGPPRRIGDIGLTAFAANRLRLRRLFRFLLLGWCKANEMMLRARARDDGVPLRFGFQLTGHVGSLDDSRGLKTARSAILRKREIDGPILAIGNIKAGTTPRTGADPKCPLSRLKTKNLYGTIS
jgi:hypothetical protein